MSFGSEKKSAPQFEEFQDTPWITQARDIADIGGQGVLDNYKNVDWFDDATKSSIESRNNEVYRRAFNDMNRQYNNIMNDYAARNYNRFGTLNATPSAYLTDEYKRDFQRQMDDLAYNKAVNYENLVNNELQRRYNTLDMYHNLYQYGATPHQIDIDNWNTRNTNKSMAWNAQNASSSGSNGLGSLLSALGTMSGAFIGAGRGGGQGGGVQ
jgi:hypothetical protein